MGSDDYIRMKYTVQGSRSQGVVQLESKKVKVRSMLNGDPLMLNIC